MHNPIRRGLNGVADYTLFWHFCIVTHSWVSLHDFTQVSFFCYQEITYGGAGMVEWWEHFAFHQGGLGSVLVTLHQVWVEVVLSAVRGFFALTNGWRSKHQLSEFYIINSVDKTRFLYSTSLPTQHHSFFRNYPLHSFFLRVLHSVFLSPQKPTYDMIWYDADSVLFDFCSVILSAPAVNEVDT